VDIAPFVGKAFRHFREERDWSQEDLAHACELDRTYISGIERGVRNPSLSSMLRVANALEVRLDVVLAKAYELCSDA